MAKEKTIKFKAWATIEEMYLDADGVEQHRDVTVMPYKLGEFNTEVDAALAMEKLQNNARTIPEWQTLTGKAYRISNDGWLEFQDFDGTAPLPHRWKHVIQPSVNDTLANAEIKTLKVLLRDSFGWKDGLDYQIIPF